MSPKHHHEKGDESQMILEYIMEIKEDVAGIKSDVHNLTLKQNDTDHIIRSHSKKIDKNDRKILILFIILSLFQTSINPGAHEIIRGFLG